MADEIEDARFREMLRQFPDQAVQQLFIKYRRRMVALARSITFDPMFSEDIVQDAFLHLLQKHRLISKHHKMPLENYIVTVVKYKAITYTTKVSFNEQRLRKYYNYGHSLSHTNAETQIIEKEIGDEVRNLIQLLAKKERQCLLMRIENEMDVETIAERLGVGEKAVEARITAAKKKLRQLWLKRNRPMSWIF
jgi:RNA polymerase sigma factor (sigma-70 family)